MKKTGISVVVPVYNSAVGLPELVERLEKMLRDLGGPFELIMVNDGSVDDSGRVLIQLSHTHSELVPIDLARNFGQQNATLCGARLARYPITVTLDDDLQHPPEEVPKLIALLNEGHDCVYGYAREGTHGRRRNFVTAVAKNTMSGLLGVSGVKELSGFRAYRTSLRDAFHDFNGPDVSIDALLAWSTSRFASLPVEHAPRRYGRSNYNLRKLASVSFDLIFSFSSLPLRLAIWTGFLAVLLGIGLFVYVIVVYATQSGRVPGFAFLASALSIFSGAQLFSLGVMGEYLARIHSRTLGVPAYAVRAEARDAEVAAPAAAEDSA